MGIVAIPSSALDRHARPDRAFAGRLAVVARAGDAGRAGGMLADHSMGGPLPNVPMR